MDTPTQNPPAQPVVHVGNLSFKTTTYELQTLFSEVAPVVKLTLKPKADQVSSYAFVTFPSVDDCEKIIKEFNYFMLHNKQMNITPYSTDKNAPSDGNIFVKNLPPNLNSKDLSEIFKMFGQIVSCKVASSANGELKGFGYVQYRNPKSAKKAIASCKNVKIGAHTLEVEEYDTKIRETKISKEVPAVAFTNCYIKNFPMTLTEKELKSMLERYGTVSSLYFPTKEDGAPVGYACANYSTPEEATEAIEALHNKFVFPEKDLIKEEGLVPLPFYIQKAENKKDRTETLRRQLEMLSFDGQRSKCNLYVSNIPDSFSHEEIKNIFLKFGKVTNFKIASAGSPNQKQYGYICYATPEEAAIAFEKIDGTFLDGNKLQISYYKTKSERIMESDSAFGAGPAAGNAKRPSFLDPRNVKLEPSTRKLLQILYDSILKTAKSYNESWTDFGAENEVVFAQKIALTLVDFPANHLKEMINDKNILDDFIQRSIKNIRGLQGKIKPNTNL